MPIQVDQFENQVYEIDSSGSIYKQHFDNSLLDSRFLNLKHINYSKTSTGAEPKNSKIDKQVGKPGNSFISFENSDLILVILISLFAILGYIRISGKTYYKRLFMSVQNYSYSISFFREKNLAFVLFHNLMILIFLVSSGMVAEQIALFFNISIPMMEKLSQIFVFIVIIALLVFLNRIIVRISGIVFGYYKISSEYLFYYSNLLKVLGIYYLIISVILFFISPETKFIFIYLTLFISAIIYLVKSIRILIIFFNNRLSLYYLILYFCALEIIPVVLIIKLIAQIVKNGYSFSGILV